MTANPPPHTRSGRLRRTARTTVAALSLLLATASSALVGPAAAAATPSPVPSNDEPDVSVVLAPENHGSYAPGAPLSATVSIVNATDVDLPAGTVSLDLGRTALPDRAALISWLSDDSSPLDLDPLTSASTPQVSGTEQESSALLVSPPMLGQLTPGIYPLRATITVASTDSDSSVSTIKEEARSVLIVSAADVVNTPMSVMVPLTATPSGSILNEQELADLTSATGALTTQLDELLKTSAIIAVDPAIVAAIRVLGTAAPASATSWLARLTTAPNDVFLLQFADADVTAQIAAGLTEPLQPTTLAPFIDPNGFAASPNDSSAEATASPTPTPTETASPEAPELPTLEQLATLSRARGNIFWPRGNISADELTTLAQIETPTAEPTIVLPSTSFTEGADNGFVPARVDINGASVLVTDAVISATLNRAVSEVDAATRSAALTEVLAFRSYLGANTPVLAGLDRADLRPSAALLDALTAVSGSRAASLTELLTTPPQAASLSSQSDALRAGSIDVLLADERELEEFSSILLEPAQLTARERISMLQLLAVGAHTDDASFSVALAEHRTQTSTTLNAVGIQPSNPILISAAVDVPVWVRNDLPYPITLRLDARPSDARIEVQRSTVIEALPSSTTRVKVPVVTRVASGEVDLTLSLFSKTGVPIGTPQVTSLTVRAEWETIGLITFGGLAALLIGAGIARTIHKRRMDAAATAPGAPQSTTPEAPSRH